MVPQDLIPISVATLAPTSCLGIDLYTQTTAGDGPVLFRGSEYPLETDDLSRLKTKGISRLYIAKESRDDYQQYLRAIAENTLEADVSEVARAGAMNTVVLDVLENAFESGDTKETVGSAQHLGQLTAELVGRTEFAAENLFNVLHHDYATFTHSANVAFYAAMLAAELSLPSEEIEQIATGGLLHDLGKLEIPEKILCKPGKLDRAEFQVIQKHPLVGLRKLARREDLSYGQLMMVYQHHERNDGSGYPVGHDSKGIHDFAKLTAVVDVFEALTSQRPYRTPMTRQEALEILERDAGKALDLEIVKCWKAVISRISKT